MTSLPQTLLFLGASLVLLEATWSPEALGNERSAAAGLVIADGLGEIDSAHSWSVSLRFAWSTAFVTKYGGDAAGIAAGVVLDEGAGPTERALHLDALVLADAAWARRIYPRFVDSQSDELRLAALDANAALWDYSLLRDLRVLEDSHDPAVRAKARNLLRRYHIWGPTRPSNQDRADADRGSFQPYDRASLRAWRARRGAWRQRQEMLVGTSS